MAIALVASTALVPAGINGGTSPAIDTTGANLLVVSGGWYNSVTLSDSKGNTWTGLTTRSVSSAQTRLFYCLGATVGPGHTFTFSGSGIYGGATVMAFAGVAGYQTESGATSSGVQPIASGSVTPLTPGALILSSLATGMSGPGVTVTDVVAPPGFAQITAAGQYGAAQQVSTGYVVQTTAAAINPTWSWSGTGTHTDVGVATAVFLATLPVTAPLVAYVKRDWGTGGGWGVRGGTTDPIDTTGANLLVISAGWYQTTAVAATVSDNKGNTWAPLTLHGAGNLFGAHRIWYATNVIVGANHRFTITTNFDAWPGAVVYAFSGAHPTAPFDVENGATSSSGSGSLATGSITPTAAGAYLVSGAQAGDGQVSAVTTALATDLKILFGSAAAHTIQTPAAAINPSWTHAASTQGGAASIAAFLPPPPPAVTRLTQAPIELLSRPVLPGARLTQDTVELLSLIVASSPVPNVVGLTLADATTAITAAGFTVGTVT